MASILPLPDPGPESCADCLEFQTSIMQVRLELQDVTQAWKRTLRELHLVKGQLAAEQKQHPQAAAAREVYEYWKKRCRPKARSFDGDREKKVLARLNEGYTVEELKLAIDGAAEEPTVVEGRLYDDLELICRDPCKTDAFMQRGDRWRQGQLVLQTIEIDTSSVYAAALSYARLGVPVFPVSGKRPFPRTQGFKEATTDSDRIKQWWEQWPDANVAIACGQGRVVLDVDDGDSLVELEARFGKLPQTVSATTPSGGQHYYFKVHQEIRPSVGEVGAGLDIRGDGSYVVAPPSAGYEWDNEPGSVQTAEMPKWLMDKIIAPRRQDHAPRVLPSVIPPGERNDMLFRLAMKLRHEGSCGETELLALLSTTNQLRCNPPLSARELRQIAFSATRYQP